MEVSKIAIGNENPKIPLTGSSVKRTKLSDITNTVNSSISNAQFQEKSKEVNCIVTKDCIRQIMEENARLLKTLGERNKIIEFTSIELQKLRILLEKANQQNRSLAQANSQMQSELTLSKERLRAFQHELGCTIAVLRLKNSELDEKNKLNKELSEKIRIQSERPKLVEIATEGRQVGNSMAYRLDRDSQLDEEKLNNGHREETKSTVDYNYADVATDVSLLHPVSNSRACIPKRKITRRSKALGSITLTDEAKEKPNNEPHENIRSEAEHSECAEVVTDASLSHPADDNMACEPNRKRITRSQSLDAAATVTHQVEINEKDTRGIRPSGWISNFQTTEASESKDYLLEVVNAEIPACSVMSDPPNQVEAKEKDDTRTQKSLRNRSNTLKSEACKSKDYLLEMVDAEIPACSVMSEPLNQAEAKQKDDTRTWQSLRRRSNTLKSKDHLLEVADAEIPACSVMMKSELLNQVEAMQNDDKRPRKSLRRSSSTLKSEACESKDHLHRSADVKNPTFSTIVESPNKEKTDALAKHEERNAQKDQITTTATTSTTSECQGQEVRRTSVGRPMRKAAGKVSTYKEISINVKMRRPASLPQ